MAQVNYSDNGLVFITKQTFSAVSDVDFDNVFSDTYSQYKIIFDLPSSGGELRGQWRASGSDITSASYYQQNLNVASTTNSGQRLSAQTLYQFGNASAYDFVILELLNPFQSKYVTGIGFFSIDGESGGPALRMQSYGYSATTSFDGIRFFPEFGTFTGTIYIYGYKES